MIEEDQKKKSSIKKSRSQKRTALVEKPRDRRAGDKKNEVGRDSAGRIIAYSWKRY